MLGTHPGVEIYEFQATTLDDEKGRKLPVFCAVGCDRSGLELG